MNKPKPTQCVEPGCHGRLRQTKLGADVGAFGYEGPIRKDYAFTCLVDSTHPEQLWTDWGKA